MSTTQPEDLERCAGAVIVGGFDGPTLPESVRARLAAGHLAGVILFRRNVSDVHQVRALNASIAASCKAPLVCVDQEGGRVARLRHPVIELPPMRALGDVDDVALTLDAGRVLGEELRALGFNLDFAPVCDVDSNPANPVIGDRAFGRDAAAVIRHATAFVKGLRAGGVMACAKHFPGHGDTAADSHHELPHLAHDRARLDAVELPPFRAAIEAGVDSVMTAHVRFDALDPDVPATLSPAVMTGLLRKEMARGRDDLAIVSDDLEMRAVADRWSVAESAVKAVEAGCDLLLICHQAERQEAARVALRDAAIASPTFARRLCEAASRVDALRARCPPSPVADDAALDAVLDRPAHHALRDALAARVAAKAAGRDPTER